MTSTISLHLTLFLTLDSLVMSEPVPSSVAQLPKGYVNRSLLHLPNILNPCNRLDQKSVDEYQTYDFLSIRIVLRLWDVQLVARLLGVESGQDAVLRAMLYEHATEEVAPYGITVAEFTNRFSDLRNKLGNKGLIKDEGLTVKESQGAEGKISGNILAGDEYSVAYHRSPKEILRIVYGSGKECKPGGFFPNGADGKIAKSYL